jgi:hypothetical protein
MKGDILLSISLLMQSSCSNIFKTTVYSNAGIFQAAFGTKSAEIPASMHTK